MGWRAASYDTLQRVAEQTGAEDVANEARREGGEIYQKELKLFKELKEALD